MAYQIIQNFIPIGSNRPGIALRSLQGLTFHSTATPGATDEGERNYFATHPVKASAHCFGDWDSIMQIIPFNEMAYHSGVQIINQTCWSYEMCEPSLSLPYSTQVVLFNEVWKRAVWFGADFCRKTGLGVDKITSHAIITQRYNVYGGHTDPTEFFARYGKNWNMFIAAISFELAGGNDVAINYITPSETKTYPASAMDQRPFTPLMNTIDKDGRPGVLGAMAYNTDTASWLNGDWEVFFFPIVFGSLTTPLRSGVVKGAPRNGIDINAVKITGANIISGVLTATGFYKYSDGSSKIFGFPLK